MKINIGMSWVKVEPPKLQDETARIKSHMKIALASRLV